MKLILKLDEETNYTQMTLQEGEATVDTLIAVLLSGLDAVATEALSDASEDEKLDLYETLCALFDRFLEKVFPEISAKPFDFTDAAVLYAQDMIIDKAAKEGKSYKEVMEDFEKEAKEYIENKRRTLA